MFNFPWTNFHELNLDWILSVVKEAKEIFDNGRSDIDYAVDTADEAKEIATQAAEATIPDNSISTIKIQDGAVTHVKLANNAVTTDNIVDRTIIGNDIAENTIESYNIKNGTIIGADIADDAITYSKLAASSVVNSKIADNAVTEPKIANGAVTEDKIANGAITTNKLADSLFARYTSVAGVSGVTINENRSYTIGKLVVVNVRFTTTAQTGANSTVFQGLPAPATSLAAGSAVVALACNKVGIPFTMVGSGEVMPTVDAPAQLYVVSGCYISA